MSIVYCISTKLQLEEPMIRENEHERQQERERRGERKRRVGLGVAVQWKNNRLLRRKCSGPSSSRSGCKLSADPLSWKKGRRKVRTQSHFCAATRVDAAITVLNRYQAKTCA